MNIAYIITSAVVSASNGVKSQIFTWKEGLEKKGHSITLISSWENNDWKSFDIIHLFTFNELMADYVRVLAFLNGNIVVSPILDTIYSINTIKFMSRWGSSKFKLSNRFHSFRKVLPIIKQVYVRSKFEMNYMVDSFGYKENQVMLVPLAYGEKRKEESLLQKESFCFHLSFLADDRKNVERMIQAAEKYNFSLKLAGKLRNKNEEYKLKKWLEGTKNVEYLGFLSEEEKVRMYQKAKVFALPSINEGVGIVALEAATYGCDIVITNIGGPKEYYGNLAKQVDPYSIDDIGKNIKSFLDGDTFQPQLKEHIQSLYNTESVIERLEAGYKKLL